jgi:hypothetical protein
MWWVWALAGALSLSLLFNLLLLLRK